MASLIRQAQAVAGDRTVLRHGPAIMNTPTMVEGRGVTHLAYRVRREG